MISIWKADGPKIQQTEFLSWPVDSFDFPPISGVLAPEAMFFTEESSGEEFQIWAVSFISFLRKLTVRFQIKEYTCLTIAKLSS